MFKRVLLIIYIYHISLFGVETDLFKEANDIFSLTISDLKSLKVSSVSKSEQSLSETPARILVIPKEQIEKMGFRNLSELLSTMPQISTHNFAEGAMVRTMTMRGVFGYRYFKILRDGIEIDKSYGEVNSVYENYPLIGVERVEVIYGPASVIYGGDAISGVINIVTNFHSPSSVTLSGGFRGYYYGDAVVTTPILRGNLILGGTVHRDPEYKLYERFREDFPQRFLYKGDEILISAEDRKYSIDPVKTDTFYLAYKDREIKVGFNWSRISESTLLGKTPTTSISVFSKDANIYTEFMNIYGTYSKLLESGFRLSTTISYENTEIAPESFYQNRFTDFNRAYKYSLSEKSYIEQLISYTLKKHKMVAGFRYEHIYSIPITPDLPIPFLDPRATYIGSDIPLNYYKTSFDNLSAFIQDQYTINRNWQLSFAIRYDLNSGYKNSINPRITVLNFPSSESINKLSYSEAYLAPSTSDMYRHYGDPFEYDEERGVYYTGYYKVPNPDLEPEKSRTLEYNHIHYIEDNLNIDFSIFYNKITGLVTDYYGEDDTDFLSSNGFKNYYIEKIKKNINRGESRNWGGDISIFWSREFDEVDVDIWASYSYNDGELIDNNNKKTDLGHIREHQIVSAISLGFNNYIISPKIYANIGNRSNYFPYGESSPEYLNDIYLTDLYLAKNSFYGFKVSATVKNLFDRKYYDLRKPVSIEYRVPQLGRTWYFSLKKEF